MLKRFALAGMMLLLTGVGAQAATRCLVIADAASGGVLRSEGTQCDEGMGPASTFKLPLAVIGFESGILEDADNPAWPYKKSYEALRAADRETTTPRRWLEHSVLWFSREMVARLGADAFAAEVRRLGYGNADVSGEPGKNNGLTHSWLNTSLMISPRQQAGFVRRLLIGSLPVSERSAAFAIEALPRFGAGDGWTLVGKTGTGYVREASGEPGRRQYGWFVGWGERGEERAVFAYLIEDKKSGQSAAGPRARDDLIGRWASLLR